MRCGLGNSKLRGESLDTPLTSTTVTSQELAKFSAGDSKTRIEVGAQMIISSPSPHQFMALHTSHLSRCHIQLRIIDKRGSRFRTRARHESIQFATSTENENRTNSKYKMPRPPTSDQWRRLKAVDERPHQILREAKSSSNSLFEYQNSRSRSRTRLQSEAKSRENPYT